MSKKEPMLQDYSTDELASELIGRKDLFEGRHLKRSLYELFVELGVVACVDGIPFRKSNGKIELMAIARNTGPFKNKLCSVGGRILLEESVESALRRHFATDLGVEIEMINPWDKPVIFHQFMRPHIDGTVLPDFGAEPQRRHALSLIYLVKIEEKNIEYGQTEFGGQEASGTRWFSKDEMPADSEFGYGQEVYYKKCLEIAQSLMQNQNASLNSI